MRRAVVLVVVDAADFDGSLPRVALEGLFSNIEGYQVGTSASSARSRYSTGSPWSEITAVARALKLPS